MSKPKPTPKKTDPKDLARLEATALHSALESSNAESSAPTPTVLTLSELNRHLNIVHSLLTDLPKELRSCDYALLDLGVRVGNQRELSPWSVGILLYAALLSLEKIMAAKDNGQLLAALLAEEALDNAYSQ